MYRGNEMIDSCEMCGAMDDRLLLRVMVSWIDRFTKPGHVFPAYLNPTPKMTLVDFNASRRGHYGELTECRIHTYLRITDHDGR